MKNIQVVKIGTTLNIYINGRLLKKNCSSNDEAKELFALVLKVKENPTEENIKSIYMALNIKTRVAMECGLEANPDTGEVYLAGFSTPIPDKLVEVIKEYHENNYPLKAITNFWKLLMTNPDLRVRQSAFNFIQKHDFVLTEEGYMVVYKAVYYKDNEDEKRDNILAEFVSNKYLHVKKQWTCSPNKYTVYRDLADSTLHITKNETLADWDVNERNIDVIGNLGELFKNIDSLIKKEEVHYTDMYSRKMDIVLGKIVRMDRKACNGDPAVECSYGLHVGATKYVQSYANSSSKILVCLVNPAHIVAVPTYDATKMRVSEYFPFAVATYENGRIDIIEQPYFESDYLAYERKELNEMVAKIKNNEKPLDTAMKGEPENRPMEELIKIVETRMVDINSVLDTCGSM